VFRYKCGRERGRRYTKIKIKQEKCRKEKESLPGRCD
jgi:hypothetical protein